MRRYEQFVRSHMTELFRQASEVLDNDEDAALAAQFLCLQAYRRLEKEEWRSR